MESIAPPLHLTTYLLRALETSQSLENCVRHYIQTESNDISLQLKVFYEAWLHQNHTSFDFLPAQRYHRRALFEVLAMGFAGKSIYPMLKSLEEELIQVSEQHIHEQAAKLPFLLLLPLLLLQTPAFLILLFGPILQQLREAF